MSGSLIGLARNNPTITASYVNGQVSGTRSVNSFFSVNDNATVTDSYRDIDTSGIQDDSDNDAPEGKTTAELQNPTGHTGIYENWNVDVDNADGDNNLQTGGDNPWVFGENNQYPALLFGSIHDARTQVQLDLQTLGHGQRQPR